MARRNSTRETRSTRETFRVDREMIQKVETLVDDGEYANRSEVYRAALESFLPDLPHRWESSRNVEVE